MHVRLKPILRLGRMADLQIVSEVSELA